MRHLKSRRSQARTCVAPSVDGGFHAKRVRRHASRAFPDPEVVIPRCRSNSRCAAAVGAPLVGVSCSSIQFHTVTKALQSLEKRLFLLQDFTGLYPADGTGTGHSRRSPRGGPHRNAKLETNYRSRLPANDETIPGHRSTRHRARLPTRARAWSVRCADGAGSSWIKAFGLADDHEEANGETVLDFWQAQIFARTVARGGDNSGAPMTVAQAIDHYEVRPPGPRGRPRECIPSSP